MKWSHTPGGLAGGSYRATHRLPIGMISGAARECPLSGDPVSSARPANEEAARLARCPASPQIP